MNRFLASVLLFTTMASGQFWGNDGFPEVMNWDRFRALTGQLGLSQAQVNGLLPAHDAYVKAFRGIIEDDFADFIEKDDNDGKYQWASADPELAASFRSRRSKYRNLCDELEEAEDELFDLAYAYLTETQRLRLEDVRGRRERERLRAQTWPGFEWNFGGAMSIEAQDLLDFSELVVTEDMEIAAIQHGKTQTNAIRTYRRERLDTIQDRLDREQAKPDFDAIVDPAITKRLGQIKRELGGKGGGKGGGGKGGGSRAARPDLSEEEIEDLKAEFAMLQEEFEAQMASSEDLMFEGAWDFNKSDDVRKKADQAIARSLKSFVQSVLSTLDTNDGYRFRLRVLRQMYPGVNQPSADPLFARRINEAEKEDNPALTAELTEERLAFREGINNIWDRLIEALDDDDEFDMQDMLKLSGFEETTEARKLKGGKEAKGGKGSKGGKGGKVSKSEPQKSPRDQAFADARAYDRKFTDELLPEGGAEGRAEMVIDRSGGAGNILISVSGADGPESIQFTDGAMMIVENGQEYEVPMDGPMAIGMDIAGEMFGSRGVLLPLPPPSIRELAGVSEEDQGLLDAIIDDYRLSCADNLPEREIIEFSEDDPMSMMNMMAESENRRRERNQAIRSADELLFSTLSALFPERAASIQSFDITRQREWLMARIGSGGMEGIATMFMGGGSGEGWKVDLRELATESSWTPNDPAAFRDALEAWERSILSPLEELADHRESGMSMTDMIDMSMRGGKADKDMDPMQMMNDMMTRQQKRGEMIDAANEITDDAAGALSLLLPFDESEVFDLSYGLASVPAIGRDPDLLDPAFEKILSLDSLRTEQREALAGLAADYRGSLREVNQQMLGMHRRMPNIDMGGMFGAMMAFGEKDDEGDAQKMQEQFELQQNLQKQIDRLRSERKDLHQKTREQLKGLLDQDQITRGGLQRLLEPQRLPPEIQQMLGGGMMMGGPGF
ncbi:MAG: hypothetical protein CMJ37_04635 [Phycisphaerae bacterium]|nr:hypothetical protein [Phycisphaerae bacterium]